MFLPELLISFVDAVNSASFGKLGLAELDKFADILVQSESKDLTVYIEDEFGVGGVYTVPRSENLVERLKIVLRGYGVGFGRFAFENGEQGGNGHALLDVLYVLLIMKIHPKG